MNYNVQCWFCCESEAKICWISQLNELRLSKIMCEKWNVNLIYYYSTMKWNEMKFKAIYRNKSNYSLFSHYPSRTLRITQIGLIFRETTKIIFILWLNNLFACKNKLKCNLQVTYLYCSNCLWLGLNFQQKKERKAKKKKKQITKRKAKKTRRESLIPWQC